MSYDGDDDQETSDQESEEYLDPEKDSPFDKVWSVLILLIALGLIVQFGYAVGYFLRNVTDSFNTPSGMLMPQHPSNNQQDLK